MPVDLQGRGYPIHVVDGDLSLLGAAMAAVLPTGPVAVVTNPVVGALYLDAALQSTAAAGFQPFAVEIPDGERHKTVQTWARLVDDLLAAGLRRTTPVVALGGGVTGDITGFAAASALRGVPLVQVPTSLLAMVDSAVGGKTGVNTRLGKNQVGAFYQPRLVYAAIQTLHTLQPAELRSGLGEVIKHGVLADPALFELCEAQADASRHMRSEAPLSDAVLGEMVARSCRVKANIVGSDERESGLRAVLNLGHTVGHAVETAAGYGALRHGECVAIGLVAETRWAVSRGACDAGLASRIEHAVRALGLPVDPPPLRRLDLERAVGYDKKAARGMLSTAVVERIGAVHLESIDLQELPHMLSHLSGLLET
ncbi:MAG: 3-dehydroquinate synthase [Oligoflexia bacterium]|nr:3-dehydroquinate synthase [Oligoflexia bacterium]